MWKRLWARLRRPRWQQHPSAPESGTQVCLLSDLKQNEPRYLKVGQSEPAFFCFLVLQGDQLRAFLAQCPHRDRPLGVVNGPVLYKDDEIACNHHGALFSMRTGICTQGPCKGQALVPVDVQVRGDVVVIGR